MRDFTELNRLLDERLMAARANQVAEQRLADADRAATESRKILYAAEEAVDRTLRNLAGRRPIFEDAEDAND